MSCTLKDRLTPRVKSADEVVLSAWFINVGEVDYPCCEVGGSTHYETEMLVEVVVAGTRTSARYLFWKKHQEDLGDLHEVHWKETKLLRHGVTGPAGVREWSDPLWKLTCQEHWGRECGFGDHREEAAELGLSREDWDSGN